MITAKSSIKNKSLVKVKWEVENNSCGIAGTIKALVENTAIMDGIPKTIAVFIFTKPFLK